MLNLTDACQPTHRIASHLQMRWFKPVAPWTRVTEEVGKSLIS